MSTLTVLLFTLKINLYQVFEVEGLEGNSMKQMNE